MLPISRSYLPSLPRWEFPFFAFDGPEFSGRRFRRAAWTSSLHPAPCKSVILVWYQRNSRAACLLSFQCNNERPAKGGRGEEKDGKREKKRERQRYLSSVFSFTATLLAPDRDKAAGITLFPQRLAPSIVQILLTRVFAHKLLRTQLLHFFLFFLSPDVYAAQQPIRILYSQWISHFSSAHAGQSSTCTVEAKRCHDKKGETMR